MIDDCERAFQSLLRYCRNESWLGYDPYDGLTSPLARVFPFNHKLGRIALTQMVKRSPFNLRPALLIAKELNPKGLALAARALMLLADRQGCPLPSEITDAPEYQPQSLEAD